MATQNRVSDPRVDSHGASDSGPVGGQTNELEQQHFQRVIDAFMYYKTNAMRQVERKIKYFNKIPERHQAILINHEQLFEDMKRAIEVNDQFLEQVVDFTDNMFENSQLCADKSRDVSSKPLSAEDMDRVRTTLKQLVRDWAHEGQAERNQVYKPILDAICHLYPNDQYDRSQVAVLVPGAGLGRLMFDITNSGFTCQGNEFSFYMLFVSNYILNACFTRECVSIHPWVHQTSNVFANGDQVRSVEIPDVNPRHLSPTSNFSMSAGDFLEVYDENDSWDCICMSFFLDTAHNVLAYIERVYAILKPGGYWINFGPLLYHFSEVPCEPSIELSYEELRRIILDSYGFILISEQTGQRCSYVQNPRSMLKMEYECVFFVVQKPIDVVKK